MVLGVCRSSDCVDVLAVCAVPMNEEWKSLYRLLLLFHVVVILRATFRLSHIDVLENSAIADLDRLGRLP